MTLTSYMGIDPGISGAIAVYSPNVEGEGELSVFDVPTYKITSGKSVKSSVNLPELANIIDPISSTILKAIIEEVGAMPGQGVTSMFNFGFCAGALQAAIVSHRIPLSRVRPATWKKTMGLGADKDKARKLAAEMFPLHSHYFSRVKDDGRAEATLLAVYLERVTRGVI